MSDKQPDEVDLEKRPAERKTPEGGHVVEEDESPDVAENESGKKNRHHGPRFPTASDSPLLETRSGGS